MGTGWASAGHFQWQDDHRAIRAEGVQAFADRVGLKAHADEDRVE